MKLIVDEERAQLEEIETELDESSKALLPFQGEPAFEKGNDTLRKEIEKIQKHLRTTKQQQFRQNLDNWEKRRRRKHQGNRIEDRRSGKYNE